MNIYKFRKQAEYNSIKGIIESLHKDKVAEILDKYRGCDKELYDQINNYLDYILDHKLNLVRVFVALSDVKIFSDDYDRLRDAIIFHDMSKYSEAEFSPYRRKFYPVAGKEDPKDAGIVSDFNLAWEHHYKNNDHHYNGYEINGEYMSELCMKHMLIDWCSMSYKFDNCPVEWYSNEKEKISNYAVNTKYIDTHIETVKDVREKVKAIFS